MEIMLLPRTVGTLLGSKGGKGCQSVTATMFRPIQQRSNVATFIELKILVCDVYMHAQVDFESTICWRSVECWCTECEPFVKDTQNSSRYEFGENGGTSDRHLSRLKKKRPSNSLGWKKSSEHGDKHRCELKLTDSAEQMLFHKSGYPGVYSRQQNSSTSFIWMAISMACIHCEELSVRISSVDAKRAADGIQLFLPPLAHKAAENSRGVWSVGFFQRTGVAFAGGPGFRQTCCSWRRISADRIQGLGCLGLFIDGVTFGCARMKVAAVGLSRTSALVWNMTQPTWNCTARSCIWRKCWWKMKEVGWKMRTTWMPFCTSRCMLLTRRATFGITHATELSVNCPGCLAKWSLLWKLPAVTYPR